MIKLVGIAVPLYFLLFCMMSYPAILSFSTALYADTIDGFVHYWNLWWINKSITELGQSIWRTNFLFYPQGTTLFTHALEPIVGLIGIPLLKVLSLVQTYNLLVILSFILSGLFTSMLAFNLTKSLWASLTAGFIFAFSSYRWAHTKGHMELLTTYWLPLFVLCFLILLKKPKFWIAIVAGITLSLNLYATPYYFVYSLMYALVMSVSYIKRGKLTDLLNKTRILYSAIFITTTFLLSAPYLLPLFSQLKSDISLSYSPTTYSTDLSAPIIPGGHSFYAAFTKSYWQKLPGNIEESDVFVGPIEIFLALYFIFRFRKTRKDFPIIWYIITVIFFILSLGPVLHVWGKPVWTFFMPYSFMEMLPFFNKSGTPVRLMVVVILSLSIINAYAISELERNKLLNKLMLMILSILLILEHLPNKLTLTPITVPNYVLKLKELENNTEGIIDMVAYPAQRMFWQTIHEKPIQGGYVSRIPYSTQKFNQELLLTLKKYDYQSLKDTYKFRYWVSSIPLPKYESCPQVIFHDEQVLIYNLADLGKECI